MIPKGPGGTNREAAGLGFMRYFLGTVDELPRLKIFGKRNGKPAFDLVHEDDDRESRGIDAMVLTFSTQSEIAF